MAPSACNVCSRKQSQPLELREPSLAGKHAPVCQSGRLAIQSAPRPSLDARQCDRPARPSHPPTSARWLRRVVSMFGARRAVQPASQCASTRPQQIRPPPVPLATVGQQSGDGPRSARSITSATRQTIPRTWEVLRAAHWRWWCHLIRDEPVSVQNKVSVVAFAANVRCSNARISHTHEPDHC